MLGNPWKSLWVPGDLERLRHFDSPEREKSHLDISEPVEFRIGSPREFSHVIPIFTVFVFTTFSGVG